MSKKDKKRIKELERNSRILSGKVRTLQFNFELLFKDVKQEQARADIAISQRFEVLNMHFDKFRAGTIPSEKEQKKTEQSKPAMTEKEQEKTEQPNPKLNEETRQNLVRAGRNWGKSFCFIQSILDKDFAEAEQEKTEQSEPENHRENLGEPVLDKPELYKTIYDNSEQGLPSKTNAEPTCYVAIYPARAPEKYIKYINDCGTVHMTESAEDAWHFFGQREYLQHQIEWLSGDLRVVLIGINSLHNCLQSDSEQLNEIIANFIKMNPKYASKPLMSEQELAAKTNPNPRKAALNKLVLFRIEAIEKVLADADLCLYKRCLFAESQAAILQSELQGFRRKFSDGLEQAEHEQDEPKQDSPTLSELEQGKVWIIQTNPKKEERLNSFYVEKVRPDGLVLHTPNPSKAMQFNTAMEAQMRAANIISCAGGRYNADDFKIVQADAKQPEKEAEQSEPILPAPEQKEADESGLELGGADGADSPTRAGYYYIVIVNHKQGGAPLYLLDFEQTSCDGVPYMQIESTKFKSGAKRFDHIKQAQNFIDLTIECDAHKGYNFFIDTIENYQQ